MLRRLGHVTEEGLVTLKGRAACEIDTADELLTAELLLNGVFTALDAHQLVALVSCLVPVDKSNVRSPAASPLSLVFIFFFCHCLKCANWPRSCPARAGEPNMLSPGTKILAPAGSAAAGSARGAVPC